MKSFCSKILLFGEYSIIKKTLALAMPYPLFDGKLAFKSVANETSVDSELKAFASYLKKICQKEDFLSSFDDQSFSFDVGQGMIFESTIPRGFGVGSSGALCSAVFDRYWDGSVTDIKLLKKIFSVFESHFHGESSGIDPLISYLNKPVLIKDNDVKTVELASKAPGPSTLFLLNTGRPRRTEPLVNLFLEKCKDPKFEDFCEERLIPVTERCIESFIANNIGELFEYFSLLSLYQWEHFRPMIPGLYQELWENGLSDKNYYLKLCGAGGGGFILGLAKDWGQTKKDLQDYEIRPLIHF